MGRGSASFSKQRCKSSHTRGGVRSGNNDQFASGGYGTVGATDSTWSWVNNNACDNERRLYCIQQ